MKSNRTYSFRTRQISKVNSSLKRQSQTFYQPQDTFKLASLNSVNRGVKYNELSFLTGRQLDKLRREPLETDDKFYESAHVNLTDVRKKYDDMKKQKTCQDQSIYNLKGQIRKYETFKAEYQKKIKDASNKSTNYLITLKQKKLLLDQTITEKKVLSYMHDNYKIDKVYYDQKKFDYQKQLSYLNKKLEIIKRQGNQVGESEDRTIKLYENFMKQLEVEKQDREQHLDILLDMIRKKKQLIEANQKRKQQIAQIAERAMQDKEFNEKQWNKIFFTHNFVNQLLRNKIQKQMDKFKIVQFAFKQIKTATGVNNAKTLVSKYVNKQSVYGELLGKIAQNEKKIQQLKAETNILIKQSKQLQIEKDLILSTKIKQIDLHDNLKQLDQVSDKLLQIETIKSKIKSWLKKQLKKTNSFCKKPQDMPQMDNFQEITAGMNNFTNKILTELKNLQSEDIGSDNSVGKLQSRDLDRVMRIILRKGRKNSIGQEIFDVDEEEALPIVNYEQVDIIHSQREEVLRNNEKFMKQLKRKYEEIRKANAQKGDKKDKIKPVEVKKVEQDAN